MKKKWNRTSATQHETFKTCQRRWYFGWIEKIRLPPTEAMQRGTDIHAEAEHYLKTGEVRPHKYAPYVKAMIPHLPPPKHKDLIVEKRFNIPCGHGLPRWYGVIDNGFSAVVPLQLKDIKTTSNLRYAKTPAELAENIQVISYAKYTYGLGYSGPIELSHIYVKTEKITVPPVPKTKLVSVTLDQSHVEDFWHKEMDTVKEMMSAALAPRAEDVAPTGSPHACSLYPPEGCPYRTRCGLSTNISSYFGGKEKMGNALLNKLKAKKDGAEKPEVPTGIEPPDRPSRTTEVEAAAEEEPPAAPKKRGRPAGSKNKKKNGTAAAAPGFTLYINCAPQKNGNLEPTLFEDWFGTIVEKMNEVVKEEKNLDHYMLLDYAENKSLVAFTLNDNLENLPPSLVISSSTPGASDALAALIPRADQVIRAFR